MTAAWTVFRKELLESVRDRRTVLLGIVIPLIIMPGVTLGLPYLAAREQFRLQRSAARVAIVEPRLLTGFVKMATDAGWIAVVETKDARGALRQGTVDVVLEARRTPDGGRTIIRLLFDESLIASVIARQKVAEALARYSLDIVTARLRSRGVDIQHLLPIVVEQAPLGTEGESEHGTLGVVLPFFVAVWMLLGGQYAALDVGAGERERGTLHALLLSPPSRFALVVGKFIAVLLLASVSVVLVVVAVLVTLTLAGAALEPYGSMRLPLNVGLGLLAVGLPFAGFLSATQLLLSLAARSIREAQQLFTPLYLVVVASVVLAQTLPEWGRSMWIYALPFLNGGYLLRAVVHATARSPQLMLAVGEMLALTVGALGVSAWVYRRERVVIG